MHYLKIRDMRKFMLEWGFLIIPVSALICLVVILFLLPKQETTLVEDVGKLAKEFKTEFDKGYQSEIEPTSIDYAVLMHAYKSGWQDSQHNNTFKSDSIEFSNVILNK